MKTQFISKFRNAFLFAAIVGAGAASAQSDTATASAEIVDSISINNTTGLEFGQIAAGTGGTVTVAPNSNRSSTGGVILAGGTTETAASFTINGGANAGYAVTVPTSDVTLTHTDTINTMVANSFTYRAASALADNTAGTLDGAGADTVTVGATLTVSATQAAGAYAGNFTVGVSYN